MSLALDLPPALFDLDEPVTVYVIRRRPGHELTIATPHVSCSCDARTKNADPAQLTRWAYAHLGIAYDTAIHQAAHA